MKTKLNLVGVQQNFNPCTLAGLQKLKNLNRKTVREANRLQKAIEQAEFNLYFGRPGKHASVRQKANRVLLDAGAFKSDGVSLSLAQITAEVSKHFGATPTPKHITQSVFGGLNNGTIVTRVSRGRYALA